MTEKNITFDAVWEKKYLDNPGYRNYYPYDAIVSFVHHYTNKEIDHNKVKILEIGCGTGNNLWFAAREGYSVFGLDGSKTAIEFAEGRFKQDQLEGEFVVGDMTNLPYEDSFFDLVFDRAAMTLIPKKSVFETVSEVNRVLKTEGVFFSTPFSDHDSSCYREEDDDGLIRDIKVGTILGGSQTGFYGAAEIRKIFSTNWRLKSMIHVNKIEMLIPERAVTAEWNITAVKKK